MWVQIEGTVARLNGTIWNGDGAFIASELSAFLMQSGSLEIHINTPGGSVFDGFVIYNQIKNSAADVTFIINGLCASMGTVIMLAGNRIKMLDNSFIMTHAPSGWLDGNADEFERYAKMLRSIEDIFSKYFAKKTGKTPEEAKAFMNGDNWYSAAEALDIKLIDEVIESDVTEDIDLQALFGSNIAAVMSAYDEKYPNQRITPPLPSIQSINNIKMKLTPKSFAALGLQEGAYESEINAAIERLAERTNKAEQSAKAAQTAKVTALISEAMSKRKITAAQKEKFEKLATADFDLAKETLDSMPEKTNIIDELNPEKKTGFGAVAVNEGWTFSDYVKKDPAALNALKVDAPDEYQKLYNNRKNK